MLKLVPFFINQVIFVFILVIIIYVFSKYILPILVRLFICRFFFFIIAMTNVFLKDILPLDNWNLELAFYNPLKPHEFVSLPIESFKTTFFLLTKSGEETPTNNNISSDDGGQTPTDDDRYSEEADLRSSLDNAKLALIGDNQGLDQLKEEYSSHFDDSSTMEEALKSIIDSIETDLSPFSKNSLAGLSEALNEVAKSEPLSKRKRSYSDIDDESPKNTKSAKLDDSSDSTSNSNSTLANLSKQSPVDFTIEKQSCDGPDLGDLDGGGD